MHPFSFRLDLCNEHRAVDAEVGQLWKEMQTWRGKDLSIESMPENHGLKDVRNK